MSNTKQIFVVGSSRSGTTMMGRILGNHSDVFTFKELHFFGTIWTNNSNQDLNRKKQIDLLSRLLCIQEDGLFNYNTDGLIVFNASNPSKITMDYYNRDGTWETLCVNGIICTALVIHTQFLTTKFSVMCGDGLHQTNYINKLFQVNNSKMLNYYIFFANLDIVYLSRLCIL